MSVRMAPDMHSHLARLAGSTITTMTGRENRIMSVSGDTVLVATKRSPEGKPVPIAEVQAAADRLYRYGEVDIDVKVVGYRSAFVGAVLSTLPNAVPLLRPRRIRLQD